MKGRGVKRLVIAGVVMALAWAGYWVWQASVTRSAVDGWMADRRADGWEAGYGALRVRGFPNRIDVVFEDLLLADPDSRIVWEAPFFQILRLSYRPGHEILIFPDTQILTLPSGRYEIDSDGLRASLVHDGSGRVLRANAEAGVLNVSGPGQGLALAGMTAALAEVGPAPGDYRLAVASSALAASRGALTGGGGTADGLRFDARILFDKPWSLRATHEARPQPRDIDLRLAQYRTRGLEIKLAGTLAIDAQGTPDGRLTVKAVNWRDMLAQARDAGRLTPALARTLEQGLSLLAGLSGNRETLDLPLDLSAGQVSLGPIALGPAPRVRLP